MTRLRLLLNMALALIVSATGIGACGQTYQVLYNFGSNGGGPNCPLDSGVIAQGRDGNLYSTAPDCWSHGLGTAFRITPAGALTVLHSFNGTDGQGTQSGLSLGTDGNFYGTTVTGGLYSSGTIFRITPAGALTTIYNFTGGDSGTPTSPPIQGFDGNLYGRTINDDRGTWRMGTVYKLTPSGTFTALDNLTPPETGCAPMAIPYGNGPLLLGNDGYLYGTAFCGLNMTDIGALFKMSPSGDLRTFYQFDVTHGMHPVGPLIQGSDGNFYGATFRGGTGIPNSPCPDCWAGGVVFKITPSGALTVLHNFSCIGSIGCPDNTFTCGSNTGGCSPVGALLQATDGNIYGTTTDGGTAGHGVLFRITPSGTFTVLQNFDCPTGCQ